MLKNGARIRTTGATNMNLQSSRSHAIFTLHLKQVRVNNDTLTKEINQVIYLTFNEQNFEKNI
jgi:hypothetical protein